MASDGTGSRPSHLMIIPNTNAIQTIRNRTNYYLVFWGNYRPSKAVPKHSFTLFRDGHTLHIIGWQIIYPGIIIVLIGIMTLTRIYITMCCPHAIREERSRHSVDNDTQELYFEVFLAKAQPSQKSIPPLLIRCW